MSLLIEIDSVDLTEAIESADVELGLNQRSTATLVFSDDLIPDRLVDAVMYSKDGVTPVFGGVILSRQVQGEVPGALANATTADCVDYLAYLDWCDAVTLSYPDPVAPETVLTDLVAQVLAVYGITYTPVATGLLLDPFSWVDVAAADAVTQLTDRTNLVLRVTPTKALELFEPGATSAPFSITDANIHAFDLQWADGPKPTPNTLVLVCGPSATWESTQRWIADGVATSWVTDLPASLSEQQLVEVDDGVAPYLTTIVPLGQVDGAFIWDQATHTLSLGTDPLPAAGVRLSLGPTVTYPSNIGYLVQGPFRITRTTGATPMIRETRQRSDLVEYGPAVEIAEALLATLAQDTRPLTIITDEDGLEPGQALSVNTTARGGIVGTFLVASVSLRIVNREHWEYTITAQPSTTYQGSYVDEWKQLTSGGGSSGPASIVQPLGAVAGDLTTHAALTTGIHGLAITAGQTLTVPVGGTLGSAAYTASGAYDPAGAAADVTPTTLGLVIGVNTQAWDANLDAIAALSDADSNIIVGSAAGWVAESGATARTSLGLGTGDSPTFTAIGLTGLTSGRIPYYNGSALVDTVNLRWNAISSRLGIRVNPNFPLEVLNDDTTTNDFVTIGSFNRLYYGDATNTAGLGIESNGVGAGGILRLRTTGSSTQNMGFGPTGAELTIRKNVGHVGIGMSTATALPTTGSKNLLFAVGTVPTMVANTAGFYGLDVAGTVRMFAIDELGVTGALVMASGALTSGRVALVGTNGLIGDDADLTFVTDTLTATKLTTTLAKVTGANGQSASRLPATVQSGAMSGATLTLTNLIPAGSVAFGVDIHPTTAITSGDGGTTYSVGDGTDVDRWGAAIPFANDVTLADATITSVPIYAGATSVVLTCDDGTFNAGVVRVTVHYLTVTAATS